jgi:hypothetical protein
VSHRAVVNVAGRAIASVKWTLGKHSIGGRTISYGRHYAANIVPSSGKHTLTATVTFDAATPTASVSLRRTVVGCVTH